MTNLWEALESITDQTWYLNTDGSIRNAEHQCPLCALADQIAGRFLGYYGAYDMSLMLAKIQYDHDEARNIMRAADHYYAEDRLKLETLLKPQPAEIGQIPRTTVKDAFGTIIGAQG